tara:strand:+ start:72 stop:299 length:228 start_codon:yes stop_codon:yes gene_type:complete
LSENTDAYNEIIKILQECAKEEGISEELVKEIYDLERGQTHLPSRTNESDLREKLLDQVKDTAGDEDENGEDEDE